MKRFFEYSIALAALIIVAFLIPGKYESHPRVVVMTDFRFIPEDTYIQAGETITFINTGTRKHWPASDDHITHGNYPQKSERDCLGSFFDACKALNPGERWSFIYAYNGEWKYHDHIFSEITGTVFVEEQEKNRTRSVDFNNDFVFYSPFDAQNTKNIFTYLNKKNFISLHPDEQKTRIAELSNISPVIALQYLEFVGYEDGKQIINTHILAHIIGNTLFEKYGARGLRLCTDIFTHGCQHGFITGLLLEHKEDVVTAENKCANAFSRNVNILTSISIACLQGIGHPLLINNGFSIKNALLSCNQLSLRGREYCYDGVFIEYGFFARQNQIDKNNLWGMCTALPLEHQQRCAYFFPPLMRQIRGSQFSEVKELCASAPKTELKNMCAQGVGVLVAHETQDEMSIKELCAFAANPSLTEICATSAHQEILSTNSN